MTVDEETIEGPPNIYFADIGPNMSKEISVFDNTSCKPKSFNPPTNLSNSFFNSNYTSRSLRYNILF